MYIEKKIVVTAFHALGQKAGLNEWETMQRQLRPGRVFDQSRSDQRVKDQKEWKENRKRKRGLGEESDSMREKESESDTSVKVSHMCTCELNMPVSLLQLDFKRSHLELTWPSYDTDPPKSD